MLSPKLAAALQQAYQVFANLPRPAHLEAAPHRDGDRMLSSLTAAPLRELTGEQIGPYAGCAITTVGSERDYRHFLPRILELAVQEPVWIGAEPPVIAGRLKRADWETWPADQRDAGLLVFQEAFRWAMEAHPNDADASNWLCGVATLNASVGELLAVWRHSRSPNAALQLASFATANFGALANDNIFGGYWDDVGAVPRRAIAEWLVSRATAEQLTAGLSTVAPDDRWSIEVALKTLDEAMG
jgi:hypothetical protein